MDRTFAIGYTGSYVDSCTHHCVLGNGYRFYSGTLMRFVSGDDWSPFGAGGMNPFAYCAGDPINLSDPSGHAPWSWAGKMIRRVRAPRFDESIAAGQSALHSMPSNFARRLRRYTSLRRSTREDRIGLVAAYRAEQEDEARLQQHYAADAQAAKNASATQLAVAAIRNESARRLRLASASAQTRLNELEGLEPRLLRSNSLYGRAPAVGIHGFGGQRLWHEHLFFLMDRLRGVHASGLADDQREEMLGRIRSDIEDTFDALVRDRPQPPGLNAQTAFDRLLPY